MKYKKKPIIVEAELWKGGEYEWLDDFCGMNWSRADAKDMPNFEEIENVVIYNTMEKQWLHLPVGHYIIRGVKGELYPCEPEVFSQTYERI